MGIALFGFLDHLTLWRNLSYPVKGALLRGLKAGLSTTVGILLALMAQGVLFPATLSPAVVVIVSFILTSVDKYLREWEIAKEEAKNPEPLTDNVEPDQPQP